MMARKVCIVVIATIGLLRFGEAVAQAATPKELVEATDISGVALSPDERFVAFRTIRASVERNDYESAWYVRAIGGPSEAKPIADGGEPIRENSAGLIVDDRPQWSADSKWIYYRRMADGEVQIWRSSVNGSRVEQVTRDPSNVRSFSLSADGRYISYVVGPTRAEIKSAELAEYDRGIRLDDRVPIGQGVFRSALIYGRPSTERYNGIWTNRHGLLDSSPTHRVYVELDSGDFKQLSAPPGESSRESGTSAPDIRLRSSGLGYTLEASFEGAAQLKMCASVECAGANIAYAGWRSGRSEVVFAVSDYKRGLAQSIYVWNITSGAVRLVIRAEGLLGGGVGAASPCAFGRRFAACVYAAANVPPEVRLVSLETGHSSIVFRPPPGALDAKAELIEWSGAGGVSFTGQLYLPAKSNRGRSPLFINYYSCPGFQKGGLGDEWPFSALAEAGIAVLCINQPPYDRTRRDQKERYRTAVIGIESAISSLERRGLVDRGRVGMGGLSFGTEVAVWMATHTDALAAISITSPLVTPNYYLMHSTQGATFTSELSNTWGLEDPEETPQEWREISPTFRLDSIKAPVLFQMPEREYLQSIDFMIPLMTSREIADAYVFPMEPHIKFQPRHKLSIYERNLDWFRFWLLDEIDPAPRKQDQYRWWEAIRQARERQ